LWKRGNGKTFLFFLYDPYGSFLAREDLLWQGRKM
jgi:hypothetical protein